MPSSHGQSRGTMELSGEGIVGRDVRALVVRVVRIVLQRVHSDNAVLPNHPQLVFPPHFPQRVRDARMLNDALAEFVGIYKQFGRCLNVAGIR